MRPAAAVAKPRGTCLYQELDLARHAPNLVNLDGRMLRRALGCLLVAQSGGAAERE